LQFINLQNVGRYLEHWKFEGTSAFGAIQSLRMDVHGDHVGGGWLRFDHHHRLGGLYLWVD
jgi:hypothetical protein